MGKNGGSLRALIASPGFDLAYTNLMLVGNGNFSSSITNFNLVGFAGQSVEVAFMAQFEAGADNTSFHLTDVSLLAYNSNDIPANDFFTNAAHLTRSGHTVAYGNNVLATMEPGEPLIATNRSGHSLWWVWDSPSNGLAAIDTGGSTFNTALAVFTGDSITNLTPVASNVSGGSNSRVQWSITNDAIYYVLVDGTGGESGNVQLNLSAGPDVTPPTVVIKSPAANAMVTNPTVVVQGTASDNTAVSQVRVQLINAGGTNQMQIATGTNTWSATLTNLFPGTNTLPGTNMIIVEAIDLNQNSTTVSRVVNYIPVSPLVLTISGTGTVSPVLTNTLLDVGTNYTLTAKAGSGQVFSNWSGSVTSTTPTLTFTMQNNMMLEATFVPTPFPPLTGVYQGIFTEFPTEHTNSGFFSGTVASSGAFTAKVILAGKSYSTSGQFSAGGVDYGDHCAQRFADCDGAIVYGHERRRHQRHFQRRVVRIPIERAARDDERFGAGWQLYRPDTGRGFHPNRTGRLQLRDIDCERNGRAHFHGRTGGRHESFAEDVRTRGWDVAVLHTALLPAEAPFLAR